jgi:ATP-binding protein involved in chromosome partitioning
MANLTQEQVLEALKSVLLPNGQDIVSAGIISEIFIDKDKAIFSMNVAADDAETMEPVRKQAQSAVADLPNAVGAMVALTAERKGGSAPTTPPPTAEPAKRPPRGQTPAPKGPIVQGIANIIAVASGKGGVGKSTTAVNLALGFKEMGLKVGILDADVYGPSLQRLLGLTGNPESDGKNKLKPMEAYGLKAMSMGFLVEEGTAMIWRGPMVQQALMQMIRDVKWGVLDVLVVDMPPGTGDAQLTMAQQVPLAGAIIVSTPQDLSLIDARKGLAMFRQVSVPILGIVENMSYFLCPSCGERSEIFGHGGAIDEAAKVGVPFLGAIPLHIDIRTTSDDGTPLVASEPDGSHAKIYREIAKNTWAELERINASEQVNSPNIVIE